MTIPPYILSRKILAQCPELNISETQLSADIEVIMADYHPKPTLIGYLRHWNAIDAGVVAEYPECSFCGEPTMCYEGHKDVTSGEYRALAICSACGNCEDF